VLSLKTNGFERLFHEINLLHLEGLEPFADYKPSSPTYHV
jgi:hypothetical protein